MALSTAISTLRLPVQVAGSSPGIFVMVAVDRGTGADGQAQDAEYDTFNMFPGETVKDVKLRLQTRNGHYSRGQMVIFGDRELAEHERLGPLAGRAAHLAAGTNDYLHLFVRIEDIEGYQVDTDQRSVSSLATLTDANTTLPLLEDAPPGSPPSLGLSPAGSPREYESSLSDRVDSTDSDLSTISIDARQISPRATPTARPTPNSYVHLMFPRSFNKKMHFVVEGKLLQIEVSSSDSTDAVTRRIMQANGQDPWSRPYALLHDGKQLEAATPLASHGLRPGARLELVPIAGPALPSSTLPGSPPLSSSAHALYREWKEAKSALEEGMVPRLAAAGSGGSYFMAGRDGVSPVAVFKPEDEEPQAVNNPRGFVGSAALGSEGLRKGVLPGEGATREVAAYLLDHEHFAGVPPTAMVSFVETEGSEPLPGLSSETSKELKRGSLQQFVKFDFDCEERSPGAFSVEQCHRIFVLDLRLANCDRNASNILASRASDGGWSLTPIDHGYCLPDTFQDVAFEWMYWPQAAVPFSEETRAYIQRLDAEHDIQILTSHGLSIRPECLRVLRVSTMLLKKGAALGMTPLDIARQMSREFLTMSPVEKLHKRALRVASSPPCGAHNSTAVQVDEDVYLIEMSTGINELLDELVLDNLAF